MGSTAEATAAIQAVPKWRHRIEVAPGVWTPGHEDTAAELGRLAIPSDLTGRTVLAPDTDGTYDVVLFINVLYHLKNPLLALERIASVVKPGGTLILKTYYRNDVRIWVKGKPYGFDIDRKPKWWFFPTTELGGDPTNWFGPNRRAVETALEVSGFRDVRRVATHVDRVYYHATRS